MSSFRKAGKTFYQCRDTECKVSITVIDEEDQIIDVRGDHEHENKMLEAMVKAKVNEVKLNATEGPYQKPRAACSTLMDNIVKDPATKMGVGKFLHYFLLDQVLTNIFFGRYGHLPQVLC